MESGPKPFGISDDEAPTVNHDISELDPPLPPTELNPVLGDGYDAFETKTGFSVAPGSDVLRIWREDIRAKIPVRAHPGDSGLDLCSIETRTLRPGIRHMFDTGLKIALPQGCEGQIRPRSGLAAKHGITVLNAPGTVDQPYRGRVKVILLNTSSTPFQIEEGMRIAQLVVVPVAYYDPVEVSGELELGATDRGADGIGSTGV